MRWKLFKVSRSLFVPPPLFPPAACKASPTSCVTEGRNAQRDSGKRRLSDVDVRRVAFILTEGRTVTQSILPLRLSPIQCFSLFSCFTLEVFCYLALKRHFKKKKTTQKTERKISLTFAQCGTFLAALLPDGRVQSRLIGNQRGWCGVAPPPRFHQPTPKKDRNGLNNNCAFL